MRPAPLLTLAALALVFLGGCGTTPRDPLRPEDDGSRRAGRHRADHPPYGALAVRRVQDRRPSYELGLENYLNESWVSEELFARPVPATVKGVLERELVESGAFSAAAEESSARYLVDVVIVNFAARVDRDLIGLIPVVPSVEVEARVTLETIVTDADGRRFLARRLEFREEETTATVGGIGGTAADLLVELLLRAADELAREADAAVGAFWRDLGIDPWNPPPLLR